MDPTISILLLFAALQVKHLFADFFLQNAKMIVGRERYWHMGRAQHAGIHVVFSALIFLVFGASISFVFWIALVEFLIHFHIDWAKAKYSVSRQLTPDQPHYWYAMGTDQALHHMTYIAMVAAWICV